MGKTQPYAVVDSAGRWRDVSPDLARLLGAPDGRRPSGDLYGVVHPDSLSLLRDVIREANRSTHPFGCQLRLASGATFWAYVLPVPIGEDAIERMLFTDPVPVPTPLPVQEEHFRAFFANSFDAALITAPDGAILEANPAACTVFGYAADELRALGRPAVVDTTDPRLARLLRERESTGVARGRLTLRRKDGSLFEADLSSSVYRDHDGGLRTSMVVRDLSGQIEREQSARRESPELTRLVEALTLQINMAPDAATVYRALLQFAVAISPAEALLVAERNTVEAPLAEVYVGWSSGGTTDEVAPPRGANGVHLPERFDTVAAEGRSILVEDLLRLARDRAPAPGPPAVAARSRSALLLPMTVLGEIQGVVEFRSSRHGAFDGQHVAPLRLASTVAAIAVNDLRRQEREQAARRRAEAAWRHLREIVHRAPIMMATVDGPDHVFTGANPRYLDTLGLCDVIGRSVREVFPEIEAQGLIAILDDVYRTGEPFVAEGLPMDLQVNGALTRFYFNLVYQPVRDGDGHVTGILGNVADVTSLFRANEALSAVNAELREAYDQTIRSWGRALDIWDHDTAGHSERVTDLAVRLGTHLGMEGDDLAHLRWGAQLHDIGKMAIPNRILLKPGKLDPDEWEVIKTHTTQGAAFLEPIAYLRPAIDIPRHHHERWDGTGYPHGLAGEAIPLAARVFAVVDVYDALTSDRPYRPAWTRERTLAHIRESAGTHFDPEVVRAFLATTIGVADRLP